MLIGIKGKMCDIVTVEKTAKAMSSGTLSVYATPAMILLMENTASTSVMLSLEDGKSTVGTSIDVKHLSATPIGMNVWCESELIEIDRKRLVFKIEVFDKTGLIGTSTHERFIVDSDKFMEKALSKLG